MAPGKEADDDHAANVECRRCYREKPGSSRKAKKRTASLSMSYNVYEQVKPSVV